MSQAAMHHYRIAILLIVLAFTAASQPIQLIIPKGHTGWVTAVFSPDSRELLTAGEDNHLAIWDVRSCRITGYLAYDKPLSTCFFAPDGKTLVTVSTDATVSYWNWAQRKMTFQTKIAAKPLQQAIVSQNRRKVLLITNSRDMVYFDVNSRKVVRVIGPDPKASHGGPVAISHDGNYIARSQYPAERIQIWRAVSGELLKTIPIQGEAAAFLDFLSEEAFCFADQDSIHFYTIPDFRPKASVEVFGDNHAQLLSGQKLATSINWQAVRRPGSSISIMDLKSGKLQFTLESDHGVLDFAESSPDELLSLADDGSISFWNLNNGELEDFIERKAAGMQQKITLAPNGKMAVVTSTDIFGAFSMAVLDLPTHSIVSQFQRPANYITDIFPDPEGNSIVFNEESNLKVWKANDHQVRRIGDAASLLGRSKQAIMEWYFKDNPWHNPTEEIGFVFVDWDEKILTTLTAGGADSLQIWSLENRERPRLMGYGKFISSYRYDPGSKQALLVFDDSTFCIVSMLKPGPTHPELHTIGRKLTGAKFIPRSERVMLSTADTLFEYDPVTRTVTNRLFTDPDTDEFYLLSQDCQWLLRDNGEAIHLKNKHILFRVPDMAGENWKRISSNDSLIAYQAVSGNINVFDIRRQIVSVSLPASFGRANDLAFSRNNKWLLASFNDRTTRIFDLGLGKEMASFVLFGEDDYLIQIPSGHYMGSPGSSRLLHYIRNKSIIGFEQLDTRFNRPDLVLQALGLADPAMIQSYRNAYQKRIRKLGVDTLLFQDGISVPEAVIANRASVALKQSTPVLSLRIRGSDSAYLLDRFNLWVNDVPVFGSKGISIRHQNTGVLDTTISVQLSQGANRIETSVQNVNGAESYRSPLFVQYTPALPETQKVHFIGIGINEFANPAYNLSWSVKDVRDLAGAFQAHYGEDCIIDTLFDKEVTRENVRLLKQRLDSLREDDKVIVAYSGHGVLSQDFDYFLSTHAISFDDPKKEGLPYDDLELLLDSIRPRNKLLLIDACHSGEIDKEDIRQVEMAKTVLDSNGITHKSRITVVPKKKLGMENSFELMQNLFVNVGKGTGATIISAAGGMQYAQERGDLKNGVFTYCILDAFKNNDTLTVSQLKKIVTEKVPALTNGLQKPTSRNEPLNVDWQVW